MTVRSFVLRLTIWLSKPEQGLSSTGSGPRVSVLARLNAPSSGAGNGELEAPI
jgi:hypothetical protein